jgi:hypothetical protein
MPTRTELIWDGKYDERGNREAPLRVALDEGRGLCSQDDSVLNGGNPCPQWH